MDITILATEETAKRAYSATKWFKTMFKKWYNKNECHDPTAMEVRLEDVTIVNHATAFEITLRIFNYGFTPLDVKGATLELSVEGYRFSSPYQTLNLQYGACDTQGRFVMLLVSAPYLTQPRFVYDLSRQVKHDLRQSDKPFKVSVTSLILDISRGDVAHRVSPQVSGRVDWQREVEGIHYYINTPPN